MPPKKAAKGQAKADQKKKDKVIEDKTFGLKNKNRSKAVQKYVQTVQSNMKGGNAKQMEMEKEKKKMEKEEKKQKDLELKKLYGGVDEKKKKEDAESSAAAAAAAERGEYLWTADDFEEVEVDESRLEETLEAEREALVGRTDLTPVNEDTFKIWWEKNKTEKMKEKEKQQKAMIKKFKQTGRGISGRALFEHDASIFVDDANADEVYERDDTDLEEESTEETEKKDDDAKAEDEALFDGEDLPDDDEDDE
eukprot:TRINITY_DN6791_c0_g1_i1.p1 TRINITY_DN6791_c0_g1~~TRINITY_DN6791_c0_g1_i1.p1  ORF type:complete len:251 (+),score=135.67 TRINITY_DN6791_c0_g1_i1:51-803(+)